MLTLSTIVIAAKITSIVVASFTGFTAVVAVKEAIQKKLLA